MKKITDFNFFEWETHFPELYVLKENYPQVKAEYLANKDKIRWENMHLDIGYNLHQKAPEDVGWKMSPLMMSKLITLLDLDALNMEAVKKFTDSDAIYFPNSRMLPLLTETIEKAQPKNTILKVRNGFSLLDPKTVLDWHVDNDNPKYLKNGFLIIRILWGMDIEPEPGKDSFLEISYKNRVERRSSLNNEMNIFWGLMKHRAVNQYSTPRVVIAMDMLIHANELSRRINS